MKQATLTFVVFLLVASGLGCAAEVGHTDTDESEAEESELTESATEKATNLGRCAGTVRALKASDPQPQPMPNGHTYTQYLAGGRYGLSIYGTARVSKEKMKRTCWVATRLIDSLRPRYRPAMRGYKIHLKVMADSPGGGAYENGNFMHEELQCGSDPHRNWANLVHEFAHSVVVANDLEAAVAAAWKRRSDPATYNPTYSLEYFPWAVERWFEVRNVGARANMSTWEKQQVQQIFDPSTFFTPKCSKRS